MVDERWVGCSCVAVEGSWVARRARPAVPWVCSGCTLPFLFLFLLVGPDTDPCACSQKMIITLYRFIAF